MKTVTLKIDNSGVGWVALFATQLNHALMLGWLSPAQPTKLLITPTSTKPQTIEPHEF